MQEHHGEIKKWNVSLKWCLHLTSASGHCIRCSPRPGCKKGIAAHYSIHHPSADSSTMVAGIRVFCERVHGGKQSFSKECHLGQQPFWDQFLDGVIQSRMEVNRFRRCTLTVNSVKLVCSRLHSPGMSFYKVCRSKSYVMGLWATAESSLCQSTR